MLSVMQVTRFSKTEFDVVLSSVGSEICVNINHLL